MAKFKHISNEHICASSDNQELQRIRGFVLNKASRFGFSEKVANKIALAVDEACSNLIRHAFKNDNTREFCVEIDSDSSKEFIIYVLDNGTPFNPLIVPKPDMKIYMQEYRKGGLGIHLMRSIMDDISYSPSDSSRRQNILKLTKLKS